MSNEELSSAIDKCVANIVRTADCQAAKTELELHLEALLAAERQRAEMVESPIEAPQ